MSGPSAQGRSLLTSLTLPSTSAGVAIFLPAQPRAVTL